MKTFKFRLIAAFVFIIAVVITVGCCVASCRQKLNFSASYFYVCYKSPTDAQSTASVSGVVRSYGGAGYIVENEGKYFVTIACYYDEKDAQSVSANLGNKGLSCRVINAERKNITLPYSAKNNAETYAGTMNTLHSLSVMCYDLANGMDGGTHNQASAKAILSEVKTCLESLLRANILTCFSSEISSLIAECKDAEHGYVFSYDVRRLQIAVTDSIIHAQLY